MIDANEPLVRFKSVVGDVRESLIHEESIVFSRVSPIWKTLFANRFLAVEFNDFAVFLSDGVSGIDGAVLRRSCPSVRASANPLSLIGTPTIFEYKGLACTPTCKV